MLVLNMPDDGEDESAGSSTKSTKPTSTRRLNRSTFAGAGAGLVTAIAGCPLDVIKTKLQAQEFAHGTVGYKGVVGAYWKFTCGRVLIAYPPMGF